MMKQQSTELITVLFQLPLSSVNGEKTLFKPDKNKRFSIEPTKNSN